MLYVMLYGHRPINDLHVLGERPCTLDVLTCLAVTISDCPAGTSTRSTSNSSKGGRYTLVEPPGGSPSSTSGGPWLYVKLEHSTSVSLHPSVVESEAARVAQAASCGRVPEQPCAWHCKQAVVWDTSQE